MKNNMKWGISILDTFSYGVFSLNLVTVQLKSIKLGQMVILNVVFHDGFNLSIGSNLKLAPVPCAIPEGYNGV